MRYFLIILLLGVPLTQSFSAFVGNYTQGDLETLYKDSRFDEFLAHARDIRPSERGKHWTEMVQEMTIQMIDQRLKKAEYPQEDFNLIEDFAKMSSFKEDEFFQTKRAAFGERYLRSCIEAEVATEKFSQATSPCLKTLFDFWNNTPSIPVTTDLGVHLGELVRKYADSSELWPFFTLAARGPASEFLCQKESLQEAIKRKISTLLSKRLSENEFSSELSSLANSDCWAKLLPFFEKQLFSSDKTSSHLAYFVLKAKQTLTPEQKSTFLTTYFLNAPDNGELFNEAWTELQSLSQNYKKRELVLEQIKNLDPLPDQIFAISDSKRRTVILSYLNSSFPEYLDHYAKTCLSFLKGQGHFPMGNPTIQCRDMLKSSTEAKIISPKIQSEISVLLK